MKLPRLILVYAEKEPNDDTEYLVANRNLEEAMDRVEHYKKRLIGTYKLVGKAEVVNITKRVREIKVR